MQEEVTQKTIALVIKAAKPVSYTHLCVITECLHEGWQTSGSVRVVRMAFNLYCNGTPSVFDYEDAEEQVDECRQYTVEEIFCCAYAPYFWQAIQIRYPEYATYNHKLYALLLSLIHISFEAAPGWVEQFADDERAMTQAVIGLSLIHIWDAI